MRLLKDKFLEVFFSLLPIVGIMLLLHVTIIPLSSDLLSRFLLGSFLILIGLTLFLFGVERGVTPFGTHLGERIVLFNKLWLVVIAAFTLGLVISLAEPGLLVYAQEIDLLTNGSLATLTMLIIVSLGIAGLLVLGFMRVLYSLQLRTILLGLYSLIFVVAWFTHPSFLVIAFDASGATTGVLAVPFILSLTYGIAHLKRDSRAAEEDAFGTIAIVSAGAILSVMLISLALPAPETLAGVAPNGDIKWMGMTHVLGPALRNTLVALAPILVITLIAQLTTIKMRRSQFIHMFKGMLYVLVGLLLFLIGIRTGFMDVGAHVGLTLAARDGWIGLVMIAFVLGVVTILAEPAVHVLTRQIEDVTSGYVSKILVLMTLSIGVGFAVALSSLRVFIEPLQVWHVLLPGYAIAFLLSFVTPKVFIGMAFDAGGVATGPMIAAFILAFMQGATSGVATADPILDGLGTIALVALTPIIALQLLGLLFKIQQKKGAIADATTSS
ncbi:MAG: DUF1538 domain-containing protein [Acholeplasmatales bacterium]|nr:MAG: DUF1538 domain-containing protein [Acholeplasmatales bacterium]